MVIDLHRDSILTDEGEAYKTSCTVDGVETAQLMFVVGTDAGGLYHPDWHDNLNFVSTLQYALNRAYPSLMRPVNLRTQRFDQHASPGLAARRGRLVRQHAARGALRRAPVRGCARG